MDDVPIIIHNQPEKNMWKHFVLDKKINEAIQSGLDINYDDCYPLRFACRIGQLDVIEPLITLGCDPAVRDNYCVHKAAENHFWEIIKVLAKYNVDLNTENSFLLREVISQGEDDFLKYLIENIPSGCEFTNTHLDIHASDEIGLRIASFYDRPNSVAILLEHHCDAEIFNNYCLVTACDFGFNEVVQLLIQHGVNVHEPNELPIKNAILGKHTEIVKLLLDAGVDANYDDGKFITTAANLLCYSIVKVLVEYGANIDLLLPHKRREYELLMKTIIPKELPLGTECLIGYSVIGQGEEYYQCIHNHTYSRQALDTWFLRDPSKRCPVCRNHVNNVIYLNN